VTGENPIMRRFVSFTRHQLLLYDQIKDGMDDTCSMHRRDEKVIQNRKANVNGTTWEKYM
jgi:hypothetical protein